MHHLFKIFLLLLLLSAESLGLEEKAEEQNSKQEPEVEESDEYDHFTDDMIYVGNGGKWGDWDYAELCPDDTYAAGFSLLVEKFQGPGALFDDTALNGIRLFCMDPYGHNVTHVESKLGPWGTWTKVKWCPSGPLKSFQLKTESDQGNGDDTAVNNIRFRCDTLTLEGEGLSFGTWSDWSEECENGICGILTKQEEYQGAGDDTALNDVLFFCC